MKGKEVNYMQSPLVVESRANPRPKYIATIKQKIPNIRYPFVVKRNLSTSNW